MIDRGADDVKAKDKEQITPLHFAVKHSGVDVVKLLISKGANVRAVDENKRTMLHFAAENKDVDVVKMIINTGEADVRAVDKDKETALHVAARHNPSADVIRTLVDAGSLVDAR